MKGAPAKKRFSLISALLQILNFLLVFLLLASYAAWYVNPSVFPEIAFAGLAYPYILLANLIVLLIWLVYKPKYLLISLLFILLGWNHFGRLLQLSSGNPDRVEDSDIEILSFNIQNFINYNTSTTKYLTDFENEKKINSFIEGHAADIVCLQEVLNDRENHRQFIHEFGQKIECPHTYFRNYYKSSKAKVDAIAIFSRYPMLKSDYLEFDDKTIAIYSDLQINEDTVRVYNLHLASIHLEQEDIDFISELSETQEQEKIKAGTWNVFTKLKLAFIKRGKQADIISNHIQHSPFPFIICGDFNDTPASYVYRKISKGTKDAFVEKGSGLGITYAGENIPAFRIDFIFTSKDFTIKDFIIHDVVLSDHYPLSTRISLID